MDGSGTIDPAALNATPGSHNASHNYNLPTTSRGKKRSRSPDLINTTAQYDPDEEDAKPRKRGRPPKVKGIDSPTMAAQPSTTPGTPLQSGLASVKVQASPTQSSPPRATPNSTSKAPVVKALPTVRDHTTDQLNPAGDEYIPRERDEQGEAKVNADGYLVDRTYRLRTFTVPRRGEKLFMLATECARVLNYRDSYLLFNKNRSLFKIIANQEEKDNLIAQDILPYSYRSRQIAIVTARSMFRQFGSRVITGGRRVRDDYWEQKAIKQGFTEEDPAGEKRPGASKAKQTAEPESKVNTIVTMPPVDIVYSTIPGDSQPLVPQGIDPMTFATLPVTTVGLEDLHAQSYTHVPRPRQEFGGSAYDDLTRESSTSDVVGQAVSAAEINKQMTQQRQIRNTYLDDYWKRPHDAPPSPAQSSGGELPGGTLPHQMHSPQPPAMPTTGAPHQMMGQPPHMLHQQSYHQQQPGMLAQSPVRAVHASLPQTQVPQGPPGMNMQALSGRQLTPSYNYSAGGMWPPPQPQPSPHHMQSFQPQMQLHGQQSSPHQARAYDSPQYGLYGQPPDHAPMYPPSHLPRQASNMSAHQMQNSAYGHANRNMYQVQGSPQQQHQQQQQQQQQQHHQGGMSGQDWQRFSQ